MIDDLVMGQGTSMRRISPNVYQSIVIILPSGKSYIIRMLHVDRRNKVAGLCGNTRGDYTTILDIIIKYTVFSHLRGVGYYTSLFVSEH